MSETMRTRNLCALTNWEAEQYLKRNDVIFIPVGTVELHGPLPMDCEYVGVEALAYKLAKQCDGLVLPHMVYFHPGATDIGRGTVYMSMTDGAAYLRAVAQSLLNQGFRRQVFLTGHGPAYMTVIPMLTQFLDETKVPLLYYDMMNLMKEAGMDPFSMGPGGFDKVLYAGYKMMGRLEDIPVGLGNNPEIVTTPESDTGHQLPEGVIETIQPVGGYATAWKYGNVLEHGGSCYAPENRGEVEKMATGGEILLDKIVAGCNMPAKLEAIRKLDEFHQKEVMPRYGQWLVRNKYPDPKTN